MESLPVRSWATLPFDHPLEEVWVGLIHTDQTRATRYRIVWWLKYVRNKPVGIVQQISRKQMWIDFASFLELCSPEPVIYIENEAVYLPDQRNTSAVAIYNKTKPFIRPCPPNDMWRILKTEMEKRLEREMQKLEENSYISWEDVVV